MVRNISGMLGSVVKRDREPGEPVRQVCFVCASSLSDSQPFAHYRVCPTCRFHYTVTARERISTLADPSTSARPTVRSRLSTRSPSRPGCPTSSASYATSGAPA